MRIIRFFEKKSRLKKRGKIPFTLQSILSFLCLFSRQRIEQAKEPFKLEILDSIIHRDPSAPISLYHIGKEWWDLCAGPHVESTGKLPAHAIELQSLAGAYWRGDETKPMLQVITSFPF